MMDRDEFQRDLFAATEELLELTQRYITEKLPPSIKYVLHKLGSAIKDNHDVASYLGPYSAPELVEILWYRGIIPEFVTLNVINLDADYTYVLVYRGRAIDDYEHFKKYPAIYPRATPFQCKGPSIPPHNSATADEASRFSLFWRRNYKVPLKVRVLFPLLSSRLHAAWFKWRNPLSPELQARRPKFVPLPRIMPKVRWLLSRLEHLDPYAPHERATSPRAAEKRQRLRDELARLGEPALRTILKYSRHEGRQYREDVYSVITQITQDPNEFFIRSLKDPDSEIRWSAAKLLRDTAQGEQRALQPLIAYMKDHPWEGDVPHTLQSMKLPYEAALADIILNRYAKNDARMEATICFAPGVVPENKLLLLQSILADPTEQDVLRPSLLELLDQNREV